jgi:MraZ protein
MDAKGRLALPARHREQLRERCNGDIVVTIDIHTTCLVAYPLPEWERFERDVQALPSMKHAIRRFQRLTLGYATDLQLDGNGRCLLPSSLRDYAQLEKKVVVVGQGNRLELWSEDLWIAERDKALAVVAADDALPDELLGLTL